MSIHNSAAIEIRREQKYNEEAGRKAKQNKHNDAEMNQFTGDKKRTRRTGQFRWL